VSRPVDEQVKKTLEGKQRPGEKPDKNIIPSVLHQPFDPHRLINGSSTLYDIAGNQGYLMVSGKGIDHINEEGASELVDQGYLQWSLVLIAKVTLPMTTFDVSEMFFIGHRFFAVFS
jgi:hypothetical protein